MPSESTVRGEDNKGPLTNLLELRMPGDRAAIADVTAAIGQKLTELDVPEEKRFEIDLAVQEALANAVVHGCNNDPSQEIHCRLARDMNGHILIIVRDPGPGFNPEKIADPMEDQHLYRDHGRGVYLIRQLMDQVQFENNGKELRMWKF